MIPKDEKLLKEAEKILAKNGWKVVVIGGISVVGRPPLKMNYSLVINFTGVKKDNKTTPAK